MIQCCENTDGLSSVRRAGMKVPFQENLNFTKKILWLGTAGKSGPGSACPSDRVLIGDDKGTNTLCVVLTAVR